MSQGKYIKDILKKFSMKDAKRISTQMGTNKSLDSDTSGNMVEQKMYWSMISSLTKRKSFEGYKENIEVLETYTKCWIVVSQRSKV
jgi:indole-3-glycerol phosphate synthase